MIATNPKLLFIHNNPKHTTQSSKINDSAGDLRLYINHEFSLIGGSNPLLPHMSSQASSSITAPPATVNPNTPPIRKRKAGIHSLKPYPCNFLGCRRRYLCAINLQKHQRHHPKNFLCRYTPCTGAFVSPEDRTTHEVSAHDKSQNYTCYLCAYSSDNKKYMRAHLLRMHREIPIEVAMWRVIDGMSPEELENGDQPEEAAQLTANKSKNLICDICNTYSTEKHINMYHHVWRRHKGVSTREVMKRITNAADVFEV